MPVPVRAEHCVSAAQEALRLTLAASTTFRDWTGTSGPGTAIDYVHHEQLPQPASGESYTEAELLSYRPYAIVTTQSAHGFAKRFRAMSGQRADFVSSGVLWLMLIQAVPSGYSDGQADLAFRNTIGGIIEDLCQLAWTTDTEQYLAITEIRLARDLWRSHEKHQPHQGIEHNAVLEITWGVQ
ncbi:MAG TPA: hypothetical protein VM238_09965 [Phycisphaerae bacterium]|nr:hypothetical protein [Thermoguttaceae bacterium]HUU91524.1 hypothetical protein [Phycisphaerae bacterium]HUX02804.1 hypothetical protein [Phycisphaerae bacterium]